MPLFVKRLLVRQPLTRLDRLSLAGLLVSAAWSGLFALFPGARGGPLPYLFVGLLLSAGLVAAGIRWGLILGALLSATVLISTFALTGYPVYHLTQPKAQFPIFVAVLLFIASVAVACALSLYTAVQHARPGPTVDSRWLLPIFTGLVGVLLGAILIAGISQPSAAASSANGEPAVHLGAASFAPSLVAVPRGSNLLVVDDAAILHILTNGSWQQNRARTAAEPGAPHIASVRIASGSVALGPFTTAGTFHIMCLVHPGMNLTVIVV